MLKAAISPLRRTYSRPGFARTPSTRAFLTSPRVLAARGTTNGIPTDEGQKHHTDGGFSAKPPSPSPTTTTLSTFRRALTRAEATCKDKSTLPDLFHGLIKLHTPWLYEHPLYQVAIAWLIMEAYFPAALALYDRMVSEGYLPSRVLRAQLLAVGISRAEGRQKEKLIASLKTVATRFRGDDLRLTFMAIDKLSFPRNILHEITAILHQRDDAVNEGAGHTRQKPEPTLSACVAQIKRETREGNIPKVLQVLKGLPTSGIDKLHHPQLYSVFLIALCHAGHFDRRVAIAAVELMERQGVRASIQIWNALIRLENHVGASQRAFALYNALRARQDSPPNQSTFGSLWPLLRREPPFPKTAPSIRRLYRDMLEALVPEPDVPPFISTELLNLVLRTFLCQRDYAGVYVLLGAPDTLGVPIDVKTYSHTLLDALDRITFDFRTRRTDKQARWADFFLGLPYPLPTPTFLSELPLDRPLASHLLEISSLVNFDLTWPLYIHPDQPTFMISDPHRKYATPTVYQIFGEEPTPKGLRVSHQPLRRLVTRALIAQLSLEGDPTKYKETIINARNEMIPQFVLDRESLKREAIS